jgi:hypothetical protein
MILLCIFSLITVLSDTPDSLVIRYTAEYGKNKFGDKVRYELKDGDWLPEERGLPELASVKRTILTPVKGKIELKYSILSTRTEKEMPTILRHYGEEETREIPEIYTPLPVTITENHPSPHGNATILINPFSFDGRTVKIRNSILIKIYFRGGKWIRPRGYQEKNSHIFLNEIRGERIRTSAIRGIRQGAFLYAKLKTINEGLYEVTAEDLREIGINPSSIDPQEIEVLGGYDRIMRWQMDSLEAMDTLPAVIPAIYEVDEDGIFEEGERIIFYAHSLSGWSRNRFTNAIDFYYHPYTDTNVYWLRFGGTSPLEMEQISETGGENVFHFTETIHLEKDRYSPLKSGLAWGWDTTAGSSQTSINTTFNAPDAYNSEAIIRVAFYPKVTGPYDIQVSLNNESSIKTVVVTTGDYPDTRRKIFADTIDALNSGLNNLAIALQSTNQSIIMDYIEVSYERSPIAYGDKLSITHDSPFIRNYTATGFTREPYLLDVESDRAPSLVSHTFSNGNVNFSSGSQKILLQSYPYSIAGISLTDPTSLLAGGADWIVITPGEFISQASRLKSLRENHIRGISSPTAQAIEIEEIYDNFSYGVKDPSAIKRFLNWTQTNWNPPVSYVLLFGDGSYDDKNLRGMPGGKTSFIPIHTEGTTIYQTAGYLQSNPSWDSWFVDFNENNVQDIPIGRVTASSISEAKGWVDKLIDYEKSTGDWRMKAILLSDDAFVSSATYSSEDILHTTYSEEISDLLPDWIYKDKIYLMEYPMRTGTKPDAKNALIESMSEGALVGFYLGHGNLRVITNELVFQIQDVNLLSNWRKTPFYYFGSCDVGYFERPDEKSLGDYINLYEDGGNIVTVAAGRATGYSSNGSLGKRIAQNLFADSIVTAGDAFLFAMEGGGHFTYTFFGDPATSILIDSVLLDVAIPDTARGGAPLEIRGAVRNLPEKIFCIITEASYDTILDAREGTGAMAPVTITKEGKTLFRGSAPVINDSFALKVNIPYDIEADSGKVYLYSKGKKESYFSSKIYFTQGSLPKDTLPPSIAFKIKDRMIERGDLIPSSGEMTFVISDSSGLDLREGTNLQVSLNGAPRILLADRFSYMTGSSTAGEVSVSYKTPSLSDTISFEVFAKDNAGNIAAVKTAFRIGEEELFWDVDNYPNPMKDKTVIVYHLSREVSVEIKIFTIAGRLVKELYPGISRYGPNYAEWDGRDRLGRNVANGIYYYVIKAGDGEPYYGKIAVIR